MNVARSFSFSALSPEIVHLTRSDPSLAYIISMIGDLTYQLHEDSFSFMVDTIISQMLSSKVADVISSRMISLCGGNVCSQIVATLSIQELRSIGLSNAKSRYILDLAKHVLANPDFFDTLNDIPDDALVKRIMSLRGLGIWSAKMYLIFVLNRLDILPYEDGAFRQAYSWLYNTENMSTDNIVDRCAAWKPYSSIASRYLYKALDGGYTKTPILF